MSILKDITVNSTIHDIFTRLSEEKSQPKKIEALRVLISRSYPQAMSLKTIIRFAYDDTIVSVVPEGAPELPEVTEKQHILAKPGIIKMMASFVKVLDKDGNERNTNDNMNAIQRQVQQINNEKNFFEFTNGLNQHERDIIIHAKDGELNKLYPGLTKNLFVKVDGLIVK